MSQNTQIYWLSGNITERKVILDGIKNNFSGFDSQIFDGDGTFAYLERQIITSSCFSEKRLIIIEAMPQFESKERPKIINKFKKMLDNLPADVKVVFNYFSNNSIFSRRSVSSINFSIQLFWPGDSGIF